MKRWIVAACLCTGAWGCKSSPSEDQCKQLLDRTLDLEFKKAGANAGASSEATKAEIARQKKAVSEAKMAEFVETCIRKTSKARIECGLAASDLEAMARCDEAK